MIDSTMFIRTLISYTKENVQNKGLSQREEYTDNPEQEIPGKHSYIYLSIPQLLKNTLNSMTTQVILSKPKKHDFYLIIKSLVDA
jgi:hypothetical protein